MAEKTPSESDRQGEIGDRVQLATHEELTAQLSEIFRRLNTNPDIGLLTLVNPILALEDIGFILSEDLQDHVRKTLPFPKARLRRIYEARKHLRTLLAEYGGPEGTLRPPRTPRERAQLLFDILGLASDAEPPDALTVEQLRPYRDRHPVAEALYQLGRLERGVMIFETRGVYEKHKAGLPHHPWLKRLHFPEEG